MLIGCGIDIEEIIRFDKYFKRHNQDSFFKLVYTTKEIEINSTIPAVYYPLGFTCKEATFKALGISWTNSPIDWKQVELLFDPRDKVAKPKLILSGHAQSVVKKKKINQIDFDYHINEAYACFEVLLHNSEDA